VRPGLDTVKNPGEFARYLGTTNATNDLDGRTLETPTEYENLFFTQ
jgi:hypothetical protein